MAKGVWLFFVSLCHVLRVGDNRTLEPQPRVTTDRPIMGLKVGSCWKVDSHSSHHALYPARSRRSPQPSTNKKRPDPFGSAPMITRLNLAPFRHDPFSVLLPNRSLDFFFLQLHWLHAFIIFSLSLFCSRHTAQ